MKSLLKSIVPPVLIELGRRAMPPVQSYCTYDEALARCGAGYNAAEIASVVVKKTELYRDNLKRRRPTVTGLRTAIIPTAIGLSLSGKTFNCIDFGGGAGAHYFEAKAFYGTSLEIRWHIVETQNMVSAARALEDDQLRFFTSVDAAASAFLVSGESLDLMFTSCAIQYVPEPARTLYELTNTGSKNICVTRTSFLDRKLDANVIVQIFRLSSNGPGGLPEGFIDKEVSCPATFISKNEAERIIENCYDIKVEFAEERRVYRIARRWVDFIGYFGRRKQA